ncbi:uncharacterized protein LOC110853399 isoform X2 [Folsomia candida]|uniref:uncharacterized protein LOC110853399 isoform X2 n=1 Tax=Folsomia candida TaxID=158441 RepID=UPI001604D988|nr:uncharacterized protein LOC110853399 isoform X2 [Folsomia candida]
MARACNTGVVFQNRYSTFTTILVVTLTVVTSSFCIPQYGEVCNSLIQCEPYTDRIDQSVTCIYRLNTTNPDGVCATFAVGGGRCQCSRNCGPFNDYHDIGEFLPEERRCVAMVGKFCYSGLPDDCVENAYCPNTRPYCVCKLGFETAPDGKHCVAIANK